MLLQLQVTSITALMATADLKGAEYREAYGEAAWSRVLGTYSMTLGIDGLMWWKHTVNFFCKGVLTWEHPLVVQCGIVQSVVRRSSVPLIKLSRKQVVFSLSAVTLVVERLTHQHV